MKFTYREWKITLAEKPSRKEKRRQTRIGKQREFESNPLVKKARNHALIGLSSFGLFIILGMAFSASNKEVPTGVSRSGVVIDWAASHALKGEGLLAKIKLDNGVVFLIPFRDRYIGESLEFTEYRRKPKGRLQYRLKK